MTAVAMRHETDPPAGVLTDVLSTINSESGTGPGDRR